MVYIKDFFDVQIEAFRRTLSSSAYLPLLFIANIAIHLLLNIGDNILANALPSLAFRLVYYLLRIFSLSILFGLLRLAIKKDQIRFDSRGLYSDYMGPLLEIALINYLVTIVLSRFLPVLQWYYIIVLIVLNPLPESIYLENSNGIQAIGNSLNFMKHNFYHWIPNMFIGYYVFPQLFGLLKSPLTKAPDRISLFIGVNLVFIGLMIFRGHLYEMLAGSNIRKRAFMKRME